MGACDASLTVVNRAAEVQRAAAWLDAFSLQSGLPDDMTDRFHVVLDEVLSNVILHGLCDVAAGAATVRLDLRIGPCEVALTVTDNGPAFDMTTAVPLPAAKRAAERSPGGVGLLFVRALMDEVCYARVNGTNQTRFSKRIVQKAGQGVNANGDT